MVMSRVIYPCTYDKCYKKYQTRSGLTVHYRSHTGEKPYRCEYCGKQFANHDVSKRHILWHKGERPFKCLLCPTKCFLQSQLTAHVKRYHSIITFNCEFCPHVFKYPVDLKRHRDARHFGITYKCRFCDKDFKVKYRQIEHEKIHTGVGLIPCMLCNPVMTFTSFGFLNNHTKKKHAIKLKKKLTDISDTFEICVDEYLEGNTNREEYSQIYREDSKYTANTTEIGVDGRGQNHSENCADKVPESEKEVVENRVLTDPVIPDRTEKQLGISCKKKKVKGKVTEQKEDMDDITVEFSNIKSKKNVARGEQLKENPIVQGNKSKNGGVSEVAVLYETRKQVRKDITEECSNLVSTSSEVSLFNDEAKGEEHVILIDLADEIEDANQHSEIPKQKKKKSKKEKCAVSEIIENENCGGDEIKLIGKLEEENKKRKNKQSHNLDPILEQSSKKKKKRKNDNVGIFCEEEESIGLSSNEKKDIGISTVAEDNKIVTKSGKKKKKKKEDMSNIVSYDPTECNALVENNSSEQRSAIPKKKKKDKKDCDLVSCDKEKEHCEDTDETKLPVIKKKKRDHCERSESLLEQPSKKKKKSKRKKVSELFEKIGEQSNRNTDSVFPVVPVVDQDIDETTVKEKKKKRKRKKEEKEKITRESFVGDGMVPKKLKNKKRRREKELAIDSKYDKVETENVEYKKHKDKKKKNKSSDVLEEVQITQQKEKKKTKKTDVPDSDKDGCLKAKEESREYPNKKTKRKKNSSDIANIENVRNFVEQSSVDGKCGGEEEGDGLLNTHFPKEDVNHNSKMKKERKKKKNTRVEPLTESLNDNCDISDTDSVILEKAVLYINID